MNRTKEQHRKAVFARLNGLRRKLLAQGVPCTYARSVLSHEYGGNGFTITFRQADDRATLLPHIAVRTAGWTQQFDHLAFEQGLARVSELFHTEGGSNGQEAIYGHAEANGHAAVAADPANQTTCSQEGDTK